MSVQYRVAIALLAVLIGLPAVAAACAMACDAAPVAAASAHESCESMVPPSTGERLSAASPHDCTAHDAAAIEITAAAPQRTAFWTIDAMLAPAALHSATAPSSQAIVRVLAPPRAAPPSAPLVLRI